MRNVCRKGKRLVKHYFFGRKNSAVKIPDDKKVEKCRTLSATVMLTKMHTIFRLHSLLSPVENPVEIVENLGFSTVVLKIYPGTPQSRGDE